MNAVLTAHYTNNAQDSFFPDFVIAYPKIHQ